MRERPSLSLNLPSVQRPSDWYSKMINWSQVPVVQANLTLPVQSVAAQCQSLKLGCLEYMVPLATYARALQCLHLCLLRCLPRHCAHLFVYHRASN